MKSKFLQLILLTLIISIIYTKGILDYSHEEDSQLFIQAGSLTSISGIIPFSYDKLKICSAKKVKRAEDTLGEILTGEVLFDTAYLVFTNKTNLCQILCINNKFEKKTINLYKSLIKKKYFVNWYLDKLPAGHMFSLNGRDTYVKRVDYLSGIPLGYEKDGKFYIYNHLQFHILINKVESGIFEIFDDKSQIKPRYNIVGFKIIPYSIRHKETNIICPLNREVNNNDQSGIEPQPLEDDQNIIFSYDVIFESSEITMASRWDHYKPSNKKIHWLGIIIAESIIVIISSIIALIFLISIRKNIEIYNNKITSVEIIEDFTWKDLSGDVFRPPSVSPTLLSCMIGTGIQLFFMLSATLLLGTFGFLNPEKRSRLLTFGIMFFCIMGVPGGYISARINKLLGGTNWFMNAILTSMIYPGLLLSGYFIVNIILVINKSSAAVRALDIFSLFVLWIFCTLPLILIGSFFGIKRKTIEVPCKVNSVPTIIPKKPFYLHYGFMAIFTGLICFGTIFSEIYFVMGALWQHQIYFIVTFLWLTFLILALVSGELAIIVVYFNLCYGDYNWWWKSFWIGGSPVFYFIGYSIYYFFKLKIRTIPAMAVYFGITGLIASMFILVCGGVSNIMTFRFIRLIYSKVKFD